MRKKTMFSALIVSILLDCSYCLIPRNKLFPTSDSISEDIIDSFAPNEVIVQFREDMDMEKASSVLDTIFPEAYKHYYRVVKSVHIRVEGISYEIIKRIILSSPIRSDVISIERNSRFEIESKTNDTYYNKLWAIENIGQEVNGKVGIRDADMDIKEAWDITKGSRDVVVAILDTGVDYTHEDLADNMWSGAINHGYDFAGDNNGTDDNDPMPDKPYDKRGHHHGTHVAGVIGAVGNNEIGITGVAQNVQMMALKIFRPNGYAYNSDILEALDYIAKKKDEGVNIVVVNASYGGIGGDWRDSINEAISKLGERGIVFCTSSGNQALNIDRDKVYPAGYGADNIIVVAATDQSDKLASFSNYGYNSVDVAASGVNILSTYPANQYAYIEGTSMAAPQVSGVIALLLSIHPDITPKDVIENIKRSVDKKLFLKGLVNSEGRVNAYNLLRRFQVFNSIPVAVDDRVTTKNRRAITIDVLANDRDTEDNRPRLKSFTIPKNGIVKLIEDKILYMPRDDFIGEDTFTYTVVDSKGAEDVATVTVVVKGLNIKPMAKNDEVIAHTGEPIKIDVLSNDKDGDGDKLNIKSVTRAKHGIVKIVDNQILYRAKGNFKGRDRFLYTVKDSRGAEDRATVVVVVKESRNVNPTAKDDEANGNMGESITIDVLANDSDKNGDKLVIKLVTEPKNGVVKIVNNQIVYKPNREFLGQDKFSYVVKDSRGGEDRATVTITVEGKNSHNHKEINEKIKNSKPTWESSPEFEERLQQIPIVKRENRNKDEKIAEENKSNKSQLYKFPMFGSSEADTAIDFKKGVEVKVTPDNYIFSLDKRGDIVVSDEGEVRFENINAPLPDKLFTKTKIEVDGDKIEMNITLKRDIIFE